MRKMTAVFGMLATAVLILMTGCSDGDVALAPSEETPGAREVNLVFSFLETEARTVGATQKPDKLELIITDQWGYPITPIPIKKNADGTLPSSYPISLEEGVWKIECIAYITLNDTDYAIGKATAQPASLTIPRSPTDNSPITFSSITLFSEISGADGDGFLDYFFTFTNPESPIGILPYGDLTITPLSQTLIDAHITAQTYPISGIEARNTLRLKPGFYQAVVTLNPSPNQLDPAETGLTEVIQIIKGLGTPFKHDFSTSLSGLTLDGVLNVKVLDISSTIKFGDVTDVTLYVYTDATFAQPPIKSQHIIEYDDNNDIVPLTDRSLPWAMKIPTRYQDMPLYFRVQAATTTTKGQDSGLNAITVNQNIDMIPIIFGERITVRNLNFAASISVVERTIAAITTDDSGLSTTSLLLKDRNGITIGKIPELTSFSSGALASVPSIYISAKDRDSNAAVSFSYYNSSSVERPLYIGIDSATTAVLSASITTIGGASSIKLYAGATITP